MHWKPASSLDDVDQTSAKDSNKTLWAHPAMTNTSDFHHWQERYSTPDFRFGKEPNEFLVACRPLLPQTGKVLAVADGEGRNGVWLARHGLDVLSIDFSPAAQAKARALAAEHKVDVTFVEADVHAWPYPEEAFDVVVEIFSQFSTPAERQQKWTGMRRALKRGGLLFRAIRPCNSSTAPVDLNRSSTCIRARCWSGLSAILPTFASSKKSANCRKVRALRHVSGHRADGTEATVEDKAPESRDPPRHSAIPADTWNRPQRIGLFLRVLFLAHSGRKRALRRLTVTNRRLWSRCARRSRWRHRPVWRLPALVLCRSGNIEQNCSCYSDRHRAHGSHPFANRSDHCRALWVSSNAPPGNNDACLAPLQ